MFGGPMKSSKASKTAFPAPLDEDRLSLPRSGFQPRPRGELSGPRGAEFTRGVSRDVVLPKESQQRNCEAAGLFRPHCDPRQRSKRVYANLVAHLLAAVLIEFSLADGVRDCFFCGLEV